MTTTRTAFRAVHPDFRSSCGYVWPFPDGTAEAAGPFTDHEGGCPQALGDGICLAHTWRGVASGGIPAITVLVCEYDLADLLGFEGGTGDVPDKVRVKRARVLRAVDFPATLRGDVRRDDALPYADLSRTDLTRADLTRAYLTGAYLTRANLSGADLTGAYLTRANLTGANLSGADLTGAYLTRADLSGANLTRADLTGAYLTRADLSGANLTRADLTRANLTGAYLTGAYLTRADLTRAYLTGAYLTRANLYGARANHYTRWPAGFDAKAAGVMVL